MIKRQIILILFFVFGAIQILNAQENKLVVLNLKNGYTVKGEIIEQTAQSVKIKLLDGEIFEYKADEISSTTDAKLSSSNKIFSPTKLVNQVIAKGDKIINVGVGILKQLPGSNSEKLTIPPIPISFEYIVKSDLFNGNGALGIGGFLGYTAAKQDGDYGSYKDSRLIIGARGYLHYALVEKLDTYAGALLGYKSDITKISYSNSPDDKFTDGKPTLNFFAGCRYFFNDKIAGMAELGWGISIVTIGVAIKL
jgi:hypothetical protein